MGKQNWKPGNMLNPVPAVMVSVTDENGRSNIITVAWTGTICTNPPMVSISVRPSRYSYDIIDRTGGTICTNPPMTYISVRPERHSYEMIKNSGEFVINLTTKQLTRATDFCGVRSGRDVDKFKEMKLTPLPMQQVKAVGIAESPANIECRVVEKKALGSHTMFIAEVVGVTIDDRYMNETGKFEINESGLVMYSHGEYFSLGEKLGKFGYSIKKKS